MPKILIQVGQKAGYHLICPTPFRHGETFTLPHAEQDIMATPSLPPARGNLSRRGFIERSTLAMAAAGLPLWFSRREAQAAIQNVDSRGKAEGPTMGAIGIGSPQSRGRAIYNDARKNKLMPVRYVAACDVDARHLKRAVETDLPKNGDINAVGYTDFRELLDRKDIDAVTIAPPDQWHALIAIDALKKGKDVYLEKPLTLTIEEAIALEKVVAKTGRVLATGSQQRSDRRFRLACELVRNGRIGKVVRVECRIGANPKGTFQPSAPPEGLDWDFWLGPCPKVDFVTERCHYQYRWWYEYSGGKLTDWGAHHLDIAQWGLGTDDTGPISVEATGEAPSREPNSYNCHPTFRVEYTYANGAKVIASDTTLPDTVGAKDTNGILFVGDTGKWIFVSRGKISASDPKLLEEPLKDDAIKLEVSNNHMENFLGCVKSREKPICHVGVGASSVIICHLGVIALQVGKKLNWDPTTRRFAESEGNKLISRPMRAPWKLEV